MGGVAGWGESEIWDRPAPSGDVIPRGAAGPSRSDRKSRSTWRSRSTRGGVGDRGAGRRERSARGQAGLGFVPFADRPGVARTGGTGGSVVRHGERGDVEMARATTGSESSDRTRRGGRPAP